MYTLNGSTWQVLSTQQHATNILSNMNTQLQSQGLPPVIATTGKYFMVLLSCRWAGNSGTCRSTFISC